MIEAVPTPVSKMILGRLATFSVALIEGGIARAEALWTTPSPRRTISTPRRTRPLGDLVRGRALSHGKP